LTGWRALSAYLLLALISTSTLILTPFSPVTAALLGVGTAGAYLYGYLRLNPRLVGIELTLICAIGFLFQMPISLSWLAGSGFAGAVGAVLCGGGAREDHHFFLPPIAALGFFALIYTIADGSEAGNAVVLLTRGVEQLTAAVDTSLHLPENAKLLEEIGDEAAIGALAEQMAVISLCVLLFFWLMGLWAVLHAVRYRTGRSLRMRESLLLFRIRSSYTFLLIGALILEILSVWWERDGLKLASYPLFSLCAAGFWLVYLGILLFLLALGRVAVKDRPSWGLRMVALAALILSVYVGPFIGLADVWFDFRKMRQIRTPMP
jgi:hypothetical protein